MNSIITKTINFVKKDMDGVCNAHDRYHIERVWKNAQKIYASEQQGDLLVIELAALLHESVDDKFFAESSLEKRLADLQLFLSEQGISQSQIDAIFFIIQHMGYSKQLERHPNMVLSPEFKIVEDADRLDAIGAINIARTFTYSGKKGRAIHDPTIPTTIKTTKSDYRSDNTTAINHFYEKILLLKDLLHTESAKKIAEPRHAFTLLFLDQFFAERNGEI